MTTREIISTGTTAWDGTGDTLRDAGIKTNNNFEKLWLLFGGDSNVLSPQISFNSATIVFEGSTADANETTLGVVDPTADRIVLIPDASGNLVLDSAVQTLLNKTLTSPILTTPQFNDASSDHQYLLVTSELTADRNINFPVLLDSDTFAFVDATQTFSNKTLTQPTLNSPRIVTALADVNGADYIEFTATPSAVNNLSITNNAAGSAPILSVAGADSDVNLNLTGKGTGSVKINKVAYSVSTMTTDGAISSSHSYIDFNRGSALAATLANGTQVGEAKIMTNRGAGTATVTPANFAQGTSFALSQYDACTIIWDGNNWFLTGNQSELTIV